MGIKMSLERCKIQTPNTTNNCNAPDTQIYKIPGSCALNGSRSVMQTWCDKLGSEGEWEAISVGGSCCSIRGYEYTEDTCCFTPPNAIPDSVMGCQRKKYNGDKIQCCLNDLTCNPSENYPKDSDPFSTVYAPTACFSDPAKKDTCDPCHRNITSKNTGVCKDNSCEEAIFDFCTGVDVEDSSWIQRWINSETGEQGPCMYAVKRILYQDYPCDLAKNVDFGNDSGSCDPINITMSSPGVQQVTTLMDAMLQRYQDDGFVLGTNPGTFGFSPFQNTIYSMACSVPLVFENSLQEICSVYDAKTLNFEPYIENLCGCYLRDEEYQRYTDLYQINKECTPMCNRLSTVPIVGGGGTPLRCNQSICLIDNNTIALSGTDIGGSISIAQLCASCSGVEGSSSSCTCIIEDNTIEAVNSEISGINITQVCGQTKCFATNPNPQGVPRILGVPCDSDDFTEAFFKELELLEAEALAILDDRRFLLLIVGIIVLIIVIALIYYSWE